VFPAIISPPFCEGGGWLAWILNYGCRRLRFITSEIAQ